MHIHKISLLVLLLLAGMIAVMPTVNAADASLDDIAVINAIIDNNGLTGYSKNDPGDWDFVRWDTSSPRRIIELDLYRARLTGDLDVSGLTALTILDCGSNRLTSLDVSNLTNLEILFCDDNQLTNLNVNGCTALIELSCSINQLTVLDTSDFTALKKLDCGLNLLTNLDLSSLTNLEELYCDNNKLTVLNLSGVPLTKVFCSGNPVMEFTTPDGNKLSVASAGVILGSFKDYVGYDLFTKKITLTAVPDVGMVFKEWEFNPTVTLVAGTLTDMEISFVLDQDVTVNPTMAVIEYDQGDVAVINAIIDNNGLTGYYKTDPENWDFVWWDTAGSPWRIAELDLSNRGLTGDLNVSDLSKLTVLFCSNNQLTNLNTSGLAALTMLDCSVNRLTSLDASGLTNLESLYCNNNRLISLNVSGLPLNNLYCSGNPILEFTALEGNKLKVTSAGVLLGTSTDYFGYELTSKTVSLTAVTGAGMTFEKWEFNPTVTLVTGTLTDKEISFVLDQDITVTPIMAAIEYNHDDGDIAVINAIIDNNGLTGYSKDDSINWDFAGWDTASSPNRLVELDLSDKSLTGDLDVSDLTALKELYCDLNQLTSLNINGCAALEVLSCSDNPLTSLSVSDLAALRLLYCNNNLLTNLDVGGCTVLVKLYCDNNQLENLDVSDLTLLADLNCDNNRLTSLDMSGLTALRLLYCNNNMLTNLDVRGCTALELLYCNNNLLMNLDASDLTSLTYMACSDNQLTNLDVSNLTELIGLYCNGNLLTSLDISDLTSLINLDCNDNQLASLDLSGPVNLEVLYCDDNHLTSLEPSEKLTFLSCSNNQLTNLDVSHLTGPKGLQGLYCSNNQLTSLKLSDTLVFLHCSNNLLTSLDLSDLSELLLVYCNGNPIQEFTAPDGNKLSVANEGAVLGVPEDNEPWSTGNYGYDLNSKTVTLTAIPDAFMGWEFNPTVALQTGTPTNQKISFVLDQDVTVTLTTTSAAAYTVNFNSDGGTDIPSQIVKSGDLVTQPANPVKDGYTFIEWQLNGIVYDFSNPVTSDLILVAVYAIGNPYWDGSDGLSESYSSVTDAGGGSGSAGGKGLSGEANSKLTNEDGSSIEANSNADHNSSSASTTGKTSTGIIIESSSSSTGSGSTSSSSVTMNGASGWSNSTAGSLFTINVRFYENGILLPAHNRTVSVWAGYPINEVNVPIPKGYELVSFVPTLPATMSNNSVLRVNIVKI